MIKLLENYVIQLVELTSNVIINCNSPLIIFYSILFIICYILILFFINDKKIKGIICIGFLLYCFLKEHSFLLLIVETKNKYHIWDNNDIYHSYFCFSIYLVILCILVIDGCILLYTLGKIIINYLLSRYYIANPLNIEKGYTKGLILYGVYKLILVLSNLLVAMFYLIWPPEPDVKYEENLKKLRDYYNNKPTDLISLSVRKLKIIWKIIKNKPE